MQQLGTHLLAPDEDGSDGGRKAVDELAKQTRAEAHHSPETQSLRVVTMTSITKYCCECSSVYAHMKLRTVAVPDTPYD